MPTGIFTAPTQFSMWFSYAVSSPSVPSGKSARRLSFVRPSSSQRRLTAEIPTELPPGIREERSDPALDNDSATSSADLCSKRRFRNLLTRSSLLATVSPEVQLGRMSALHEPQRASYT